MPGVNYARKLSFGCEIHFGNRSMSPRSQVSYTSATNVKDYRLTPFVVRWLVSFCRCRCKYRAGQWSVKCSDESGDCIWASFNAHLNVSLICVTCSTYSVASLVTRQLFRTYLAGSLIYFSLMFCSPTATVTIGPYYKRHVLLSQSQRHLRA